jgi:hypothetical protein
VVIDVQASHTAILDGQRDRVVEAVDWMDGQGPEMGASRC